MKNPYPPRAAHRTWVAYWIQYRTDPAVSGAGEGAPWYDDPYWRRAFDTLEEAQAALRRTRATGRLSPSCQYRILRREEWEAVEPTEPASPAEIDDDQHPSPRIRPPGCYRRY